MTGKEIIKDIMNYKKMSQYKLADILGKSQTNITGYINRGKNEMRLDLFAEMIEAMGCEVIIRDKINHDKYWTVSSK